MIPRRCGTASPYLASSGIVGCPADRRFQVSGGAFLYETGESIFTTDSRVRIAPVSDIP